MAGTPVRRISIENDKMTILALPSFSPAVRPVALASAISLVFSAAPSLAFAQTGDIKSLPTVVVTASRIEQAQTEALPHTTVITQEMIRERQAADVLTLLRTESGIDIAQSGGPGTQAALFMRGAGSNQNLILIDGVPIRDASTPGGTAMALEHLSPDQIERIEIVRGNVSAIYGSGAIGGVIQIFTKRGDGPATVGLAAEAGSRGTSKLSGTVSGQAGATRYMVSASRFGTDGFSAMNVRQYPFENPDKDRDRNVSLSAALSHEWQRGSELGVRIYAHDAKYGTDGGGWGSPTQIDTGSSRQQTFSAYSKNRFTSHWVSTLMASQTEIDRLSSTIGGWSPGTYRYQGTTQALQWANEVMLTPQWTMTAGIDLSREKTDDTSSAISRNNASAHAGLNGKLDAHSVQLNLRRDRVGDAGGDTTGYLGYGYALTPQWKAVASASTAFLAPTLYQLYMPADWGGNTDLKPERSRSVEAGLQYAAGPTLVRAVLFDTHTRDQIQADASWKLVNVAKTSNRGLELSASSRLGDMDWRASLTLQDPRDEATGDTLTRRAKTQASLAVSKQIGAWRLGGNVHYAGRRLDKDGSNYPATLVQLAPYWLVNLQARYQLNRETSLYGRVENLLNRDYQTVYGYNQPPRGVFVGVEWRQ